MPYQTDLHSIASFPILLGSTFNTSHSLAMSNSQNDSDGEKKYEPPSPAESKKCWNRGAQSTAKTRAAQFSDAMEVRGEDKWCRVCEVLVCHKEKNVASNSVKANFTFQ